MSDTYWRETKNPAYKMASSADFLADESIPLGIRASYKTFTDNTNPANVPKNERGYYVFTWVEDDPQVAKRYDATYSDKTDKNGRVYGWGIRRGPLSEKKPDTGTRAPAGAAAPKANQPAINADAVELLLDIREAVQSIAKSADETRQFLQALTELVVPKGIQNAAELKQEIPEE